MFFWFLKLKGLHIMYRTWTACDILGIKAEQFRGVSHQKDIAFVSNTIFRCIALGHNCDYMTFYRTDVLIGRKFLKVELGAIVCVQSVKEVDTPLIQWCFTRNIHLPSRYIEKINRTEETPHSLLSSISITISSMWGINWDSHFYTRDRDTHRAWYHGQPLWYLSCTVPWATEKYLHETCICHHRMLSCFRTVSSSATTILEMPGIWWSMIIRCCNYYW